MMPYLYWMIECTECGGRRVVYDAGIQAATRHCCPKGCSREIRPIGRIHPWDLDVMDEMGVVPEGYFSSAQYVIGSEPLAVSKAEWLRLIDEAGPDLSPGPKKNEAYERYLQRISGVERPPAESEESP